MFALFEMGRPVPEGGPVVANRHTGVYHVIAWRTQLCHVSDVYRYGHDVAYATAAAARAAGYRPCRYCGVAPTGALIAA